MSISAAKSFFSVAKFLQSRRTLLSGRSGVCLISRFGGNTRTTTRSMFYFSRNRDSTPDVSRPFAVRSPWSNNCGCTVHTKGGEELATFLDEEIPSLEQVLRSEHLPVIREFETQVNGCDITFTKKFNAEVITVKVEGYFAVNATGSEPSDTKEQEGEELLPKLEFNVEIEKSGEVISFMCSYINSELEKSTSKAHDHLFEILGVTLNSGDFESTTYFVPEDRMKKDLYDLLFSYLKERGISNDFVGKVAEFCLLHDHKMYFGLLKDINTFVRK